MGLTALLEAARVASSVDRIVWRERIAAHGSQGPRRHAGPAAIALVLVLER